MKKSYELIYTAVFIENCKVEATYPIQYDLIIRAFQGNSLSFCLYLSK